MATVNLSTYCVGDGVTDDSANFATAFAAGNPVIADYGVSYALASPFTMPDGAVLIANGCTVIDKVGATSNTNFFTGGAKGRLVGTLTISIPTGIRRDRAFRDAAGFQFDIVKIISVDQQSGSENLDGAAQFRDLGVVGGLLEVTNYDRAVVMSGSDLKGAYFSITSYIRGLYADTCDGYHLQSVVCKTRSANSTQAAGENGMLISGCTKGHINYANIEDAGEHGVRVSSSADKVTFGTVIITNSGMTGFKVHPSSASRVKNLVVDTLVITDSGTPALGDNENGVTLNRCDNPVIKSLTVQKLNKTYAAYHGVYMYGTSGAQILSANISDVQQDGFYITTNGSDDAMAAEILPSRNNNIHGQVLTAGNNALTVEYAGGTIGNLRANLQVKGVDYVAEFIGTGTVESPCVIEGKAESVTTAITGGTGLTTDIIDRVNGVTGFKEQACTISGGVIDIHEDTGIVTLSNEAAASLDDLEKVTVNGLPPTTYRELIIQVADATKDTFFKNNTGAGNIRTKDGVDFRLGTNTQIASGIYLPSITKWLFGKSSWYTNAPTLPIGKAYNSAVDIGNVLTGEDTLHTYSLAASSGDGLVNVGDAVRIDARGTTASNANAKTLKLYFGSVTVSLVLPTSVAHEWRISATITKTGSNTQSWFAQSFTGATGATTQLHRGTLTETDTSAITIKCTGTATATNDIVQKSMTIEKL